MGSWPEGFVGVVLPRADLELRRQVQWTGEECAPTENW